MIQGLHLRIFTQFQELHIGKLLVAEKINQLLSVDRVALVKHKQISIA